MRCRETIVAITAITAITAVFAFALPAGSAKAAGAAVQLACADDYYAHCSQHDPVKNAKGVNACMKAHGAKLSQICVDALVAEGEVTKADLASRHAKK